MKQVLFLCTGNYYRSRFAEILFNHLASQTGLQWHADSSGLYVQPDGVVNPGALSVHAAHGLSSRQIPFDRPQRMPRQVTEEELAASDLVIAIKEAEHRPRMEKLHPTYANSIRYWHVHDLDVAHPDEALPELEELVKELLKELAAESLS